MSKKKRTSPNKETPFNYSVKIWINTISYNSESLTKLFQHKWIRWDERAWILKDFLEKTLPSRYWVVKWELVDYKWNTSSQLDLIIYDKFNSAAFFWWMNDNNYLLPVESVYAVIEVKTTLTNNDIKQWLIASNKVKSLLPFQKKFYKWNIEDSNWELPRCLYSIFSYSSNLVDDIWYVREYNRITEIINSDHQWNPDFYNYVDNIIILNRWMIIPWKNIFKSYSTEKEEIFFDWYIALVNFLHRESKRRKPTDLQIYSHKLRKWWCKII